MKRALIAVLLILGLCAAAAPFVNGILMEKVVRKSFQDTNELYTDTGSDVAIQIIDYRRGYATSEIDWKVDLGSLKSAYGINEILFTDHAEHGLTGIVSNTSLMKNSWYADFINNKLAGKDPLTITTRYSLSGNILVNAALAEIALEEGGEKIQVKPAKMTLGADAGLHNFTIDSTLAGFEIPGKVALTDLSLQGELERISSYIWDGKVTTHLGKTRAEDKDGVLTLDNLQADYNLDYDDNNKKMAIAMGYAADKLTVNEEAIGKSGCTFSVANLDAEGYNEFMKMYTRTMQDMMHDLPKLEEASNEELQKELQARMGTIFFQLMTAYEKLMKKGLQIELADLLVTLPDGIVNGNFLLELKKDMTFSEFTPLLGQPSLALDIFNLKSSASVPKTLLGDDPNLLTPLFSGMQTGLFLEEDNMLKHSAETKDGKLFLNGREVNL